MLNKTLDFNFIFKNRSDTWQKAHLDEIHVEVCTSDGQACKSLPILVSQNPLLQAHFPLREFVCANSKKVGTDPTFSRRI